MSIIIHKPGVQASIQDQGRWGYQHIGIPIGGSMDPVSMQLANTICGNDPNDAVIEFTLQGALIEFEQAINFAACGGGAVVTLNDSKIAFNQPIFATAGSILKWHPHPYGCRTYLAVEGGFAVVPELNSCSTYATAQLGGLDGKYLQAGQRIPFNKKPSEKKENKPSALATVSVTIANEALISNNVTIKCYQGPEWDWFSPQAKEKFIGNTWTVANNSNRMGYRLSGAPLERENKKELISTAVTRGIIQVTTAGEPIILMADAQTIGGYPRIARVASTDIATIAQCRPGTVLTFQLQ